MEERAGPGASVRAVLDPGVLISGAISSRAAPREILVAWQAGSFEMVVSPKLLYEMQEVLSCDKFRRYLSIRDVGEYVLWIDDGATAAADPEIKASAITRDPKDDYLAALALSEGADFLVSGDPHLLDLKQDATSEVGGQVRVLTPREFLGELKLLG